MSRRPYIVSIEGNIGSGKTTLINRLEEQYKFVSGSNKKYIFLREPLHIWKSIQDQETNENILQKFYKDTKKYAFSFQVMAYITFAQRLIDAIKDSDENTVIICERSMESCRAIFSTMLREQGNIDDVNYTVLEMFYKQIELIRVNAIIYLNVSVVTSNERIKTRARSGEEDIPLDYLEKCKTRHEEWLRSMMSNQCDNPIPVLMLDESLDDYEMIHKIGVFIDNYCYKLIGLCEGCNVESKIYSDEEHYLLRNYRLDIEKLLCKKCFRGCWKDCYEDDWKWINDDTLYTGEEYETESV
jgi:deoxyadenosine/deoxycytidine kinase